MMSLSAYLYTIYNETFWSFGYANIKMYVKMLLILNKAVL